MDESELAGFSPRSGEENTAVSELLKAMDPSSPVYDVDFRHLCEEHKLEVRQNLCGNVDFVLVVTLHDVRRSHSSDHAENNMLGSTNMGTSKRF